jgi:hypothetical protein
MSDDKSSISFEKILEILTDMFGNNEELTASAILFLIQEEQREAKESKKEKEKK